MFMAMLVLNDPEQLYQVLSAWEKAGITGATIFESTGMHRVRRRFVPMRFMTPFVDAEENHLTLLAIIRDEQQVQACLDATESVTGDLSCENTGVFAAWPIYMAKGIPGREE